MKEFLAYFYFSYLQRPNLKRPKGALSILNGTEGQLDIDVKAEQDEMKVRCEGYIQRNGASLKDDSKFAIEMFGLRKTYKRGTFFRKSKVFIAVAGNCYGIRQGMSYSTNVNQPSPIVQVLYLMQ